MKQNHYSIADLNELFSLRYLEYWTILQFIEERIGIEKIYNTILAYLTIDELKVIIERLSMMNSIQFTEDEIKLLKRLRG